MGRYREANDRIWKELESHTVILPEALARKHMISTAELAKADIKVDKEAQIRILIRELSDADSYTTNQGEWLYDRVPKVVVEYILDYLWEYLDMLAQNTADEQNRKDC